MTLATAQTQIDYGAQIPEKVSMYFSDDFDFENEEAAAVLKEETAPMVMKALLEELKALPELNRDTVKAAFKKVQKANKLKGQQVYMPIRVQVYMPIRVTLTGNQHGPELAEMIPLFGLERTEKRILKSLEKAGVSL